MNQGYDRPLTVREAAEFLHIRPEVVRKLLRDEAIKAYKLNGTGKKHQQRRWRIWRKDLVEFVERDSNVKPD